MQNKKCGPDSRGRISCLIQVPFFSQVSLFRVGWFSIAILAVYRCYTTRKTIVNSSFFILHSPFFILHFRFTVWKVCTPLPTEAILVPSFITMSASQPTGISTVSP